MTDLEVVESLKDRQQEIGGFYEQSRIKKHIEKT